MVQQQYLLDVQCQLERRLDLGLQPFHPGTAVGHGYGANRARDTYL